MLYQLSYSPSVGRGGRTQTSDTRACDKPNLSTQAVFWEDSEAKALSQLNAGRYAADNKLTLVRLRCLKDFEVNAVGVRKESTMIVTSLVPRWLALILVLLAGFEPALTCS